LEAAEWQVLEVEVIPGLVMMGVAGPGGSGGTASSSSEPPIHRNKPTISCSQQSFSGSRTVQIHAPSVAMAPWKAEGLTCRILEKNAKKYVNLVGVSTR